MPPPPPRQTLPAHIRPSMPSAGALNSNNARGASSIGGPGLGSQAGASGNHQALLTRLNEKTAELENLKELKELSAQMAGQMQALEEKLGTLGQGAEAVSLVLGNWAGVLRAVGMASGEFPSYPCGWWFWRGSSADEG